MQKQLVFADDLLKDRFRWFMEQMYTKHQEELREAVEEERKRIVNVIENLGDTRPMRIGENKYAMKQLKTTLEDIRRHNSHCDGFEEGWKESKEKILQTLTNKEV